VGKHAGYCAAIRLGFEVPETWLSEECMAEYIAGPQFDAHLVETIRRAFPPHEHEQFVAHYRGLLGAWVADQRAAAAAS
jgi:hypothetical protein